jgi:hypothetical protein
MKYKKRIVFIKHYSIKFHDYKIKSCSKYNQEVRKMANSNQTLVSNAKSALERMKYETAGEVGVTLSQGYNGDILARDAGRIGGNMVKKMIQYAETNMPGAK